MSGGTAPLILNLGTKWRWVVTYALCSLTSTWEPPV